MKRNTFIGSYYEGQALVVAVLIVTVVLTISLSLMARSLVNLRLSIEEDQSQRAFTAAEAGLERSLTSETPATGSFTNNVTFSTTVTGPTTNQFALNNGKIITRNDGVDIWLSHYNNVDSLNYSNPWSGTLTLYWGQTGDVCDPSEGTNTMPAIELIVLTGTRNNPTATQYAFDACTGRQAHNNFNSPSNTGAAIDGIAFTHSAQIPVPTSGLIARVIPIYTNAYIAVHASSTLPPQGKIVESTGSSGNVQRKISVFKENPKLPAELFTYTLFLPN